MNKSLLIFIPLLLISCGGTGKGKGSLTSEDSVCVDFTEYDARVDSISEIKVTEYTDSMNVIASPRSNKDLPSNVAYGKVSMPIPKDKAEKSLLNQSSSYNKALTLGDITSCKRYIYPKAIEYFKKYYVGASNDEIIQNFLSGVSSMYSSLYKKYADHGIDIEIVPAQMIRRIEYGNYIFIIYSVASNMCSEDVYIHSTNYEETIGISYNGGKNWYLNTMNEDTPNILRLEFPDRVVDEIMDY